MRRTSFRRKFTLWYIHRGYTFRYDFSNTKVYGEYPFYIPEEIPKSVFNCPWWVKPFLIFFSPSIYTSETVGKQIIEGFIKGIKEG